MQNTPSIGEYLIQRLYDSGLRHIFGIPGDYILSFYDMLLESPIQVIGTCTEIGAGFAADAYARVNGLGAICVTYCVGGLNALNAVAGAYAEKSPLVVISGAPGIGERAKTPLLHHRVRDFSTQRRVFEKVTVSAVALDDAASAPAQIDEVLGSCLRQKRPVYFEIPRDMVHETCNPMRHRPSKAEESDPEALREAIAEAAEMLRCAKRPVILAGVEIHRFGLQESLVRLAERSGFPVASTLLGKSVISERHQNYLGIYEGAMGKDTVQRTVERSDCVLILGAFMTDINLGVYTAQLEVSKSINATSERIAVKHHHYSNVTLRDFVEGLISAPIGPARKAKIPNPPRPSPFRFREKEPITIKRFFARINEFLDDNTIVICDIGDSLFGAADLTIHRRTEFISPAYYTSMGFAIPAAVGAQVRNRALRPLVFVGDGAFQMTGQELSTIVRNDLNPIVFVLNNKGYTTERFIKDGPYNDILNWNYHLWPQIVRDGWGCEVRTEGELELALATSKRNTKSFSIINVHLDPYDRSEALERLGKRLSSRVAKEGK